MTGHRNFCRTKSYRGALHSKHLTIEHAKGGLAQSIPSENSLPRRRTCLDSCAVAYQRNSGIGRNGAMQENVPTWEYTRDMAGHGTDTHYRDGCRCLKCKAAHAAKARANRARDPVARTRTRATVVVALPTTLPTTDAPSEPGQNEIAVRAQCLASPKCDEKPGTISQAISLSRILDDQSAMPLWPTTSRQLHALLTSLDGPKKKLNRGRLFAVQQMTVPRNVRTAQ